MSAKDFMIEISKRTKRKMKILKVVRYGLDREIPLSGRLLKEFYRLFFGLNSRGIEGNLTGSEIVSMNVWGFPPAVIKLLETELIRFLDRNGSGNLTSEFYLPAAVDAGIRNREARVLVYPASCSWMGVTYQEDKDRVIESIEGLVDQGKYPSPLFD